MYINIMHQKYKNSKFRKNVEAKVLKKNTAKNKWKGNWNSKFRNVIKSELNFEYEAKVYYYLLLLSTTTLSGVSGLSKKFKLWIDI